MALTMADHEIEYEDEPAVAVRHDRNPGDRAGRQCHHAARRAAAPFRSSSRTPPRRWNTSCRCSAATARIVITHGNGPQIGNILIRVEEGERRVPRLPLDTCVSDSQGGMGYMIQRLAYEIVPPRGHQARAATVITQVLVDRDDPDFAHPSKPIGSFYDAGRAGANPRASKPHWVHAAKSSRAAGAAWCLRRARSTSWKRKPSRACSRPAWW